MSVIHPALRLARAAVALPALAVLATGAIAPDAGAQSAATVVHSGPRHTAADVQFMHGMIAHHAQAVVMATMAPTHGASASVTMFSRRMLISQRDEIEQMQGWLRDRGERVPDSASMHAMHAMPAMPASTTAPAHAGHAMPAKPAAESAHADHAGMSVAEHAVQMPGMLTADEFAQLDRARGTDFDRLFLTLMIRHHEGALVMVARLFNSPGAGQSPEIFGLASDVDADQRAEIARMQAMLTTITGSTTK